MTWLGLLALGGVALGVLMILVFLLAVRGDVWTDDEDPIA